MNGRTVKPGCRGLADRVKTETGGRAALTFFDGSVIEMAEGTEVALIELDSSNRLTKIKMQQDIGRTFNRVKKAGRSGIPL